MVQDQHSVANLLKPLTKRSRQDDLPTGLCPDASVQAASPARSPTPENTARLTSHAHHAPLGTNDPWANLEPSDEHPNGPMLGRTLTLIVPRGRPLCILSG